MWRANWRQSVNNGTCIAAGAFFSFTGNCGRGRGRESHFVRKLQCYRHPDVDSECATKGLDTGYTPANNKVYSSDLLLTYFTYFRDVVGLKIQFCFGRVRVKYA